MFIIQVLKDVKRFMFANLTRARNIKLPKSYLTQSSEKFHLNTSTPAFGGMRLKLPLAILKFWLEVERRKVMSTSAKQQKKNCQKIVLAVPC